MRLLQRIYKWMIESRRFASVVEFDCECPLCHRIENAKPTEKYEEIREWMK